MDIKAIKRFIIVESTQDIEYISLIGFPPGSTYYSINFEEKRDICKMALGERILFVPPKEYYDMLYKHFEDNDIYYDCMAIRYYRGGVISKIIDI